MDIIWPKIIKSLQKNFTKQRIGNKGVKQS